MDTPDQPLPVTPWRPWRTGLAHLDEDDGMPDEVLTQGRDPGERAGSSIASEPSTRAARSASGRAPRA